MATLLNSFHVKEADWILRETERERGRDREREKKPEQEMGSTGYSQGQDVSCIERASSVKVKRQR